MNKYQKEQAELKILNRKLGLKKIYVNLAGTQGTITIPVRRHDGKVEKILLKRSDPIITKDPELLMSAARIPMVRIADPTAHELVFHFFDDKQLPHINHKLQKDSDIVNLWKYKMNLENMVIEHLIENGHEVNRDSDYLPKDKFDLVSMITFIENNGYTVHKTKDKKIVRNCVSCRKEMKEVERRVYFCSICNVDYLLLSGKLVKANKDNRILLKEELRKHDEDMKLEEERIAKEMAAKKEAEAQLAEEQKQLEESKKVQWGKVNKTELGGDPSSKVDPIMAEEPIPTVTEPIPTISESIPTEDPAPPMVDPFDIEDEKPKSGLSEAAKVVKPAKRNSGKKPAAGTKKKQETKTDTDDPFA